MKKAMLIGVGLLAAAGLSAAVFAQKKYTIITVVKITGVNWFNRMEEGVKQYAKDTGNAATQTGTAQADPAQQLQLVTDLLAKKPDALAVVPIDPTTLEPIFKQAAARGVKIVTHEADNVQNAVYDVEAFDNTAYGARLNERLAKCMGNEGKWSVFVGTLGSKTHNQWADGGINNAKKNPKLTLVESKQESNDDADKAYEKAKEILKKYPDIKGFQGSSSLDVVGIGRAVEEAGLQDKICVYGTSLPSMTAKLLESGAVDGIGFWDPKDAGIVMNKVAQMLLEGKRVSNGANLGVKGYEKVSVKRGKGTTQIITGNAFVDVDKNNAKDFPF